LGNSRIKIQVFVSIHITKHKLVNHMCYQDIKNDMKVEGGYLGKGRGSVKEGESV
jgi:hypothetical protein